jgi:hypothetical protein
MKPALRGMTPSQLARANAPVPKKARSARRGRKPIADGTRADQSIEIRVTGAQRAAYDRAGNGNVSKWARALLDRAANFNPADA